MKINKMSVIKARNYKMLNDRLANKEGLEVRGGGGGGGGGVHI